MMAREKLNRLYRRLVKIVGKDNISTQEVSRVAYASDIWEVGARWVRSGKILFKPDLIVWPETTQQISTLLEVANKERVPVTPFAAGGGVLGGVIPVHGGITVDIKKMNRVLSIDEENMLTTCEAGIIGQNLEDRLQEKDYTLGHYPQSIFCSCVGGWIGHRAVGTFSTKYGEIDDLLFSLKAVLPTGEIVETKSVPKASTGPNIAQVFIGSEGTLGIISEVTFKIFSMPEKRIYRGIWFPDLASGLRAIRSLLLTGITPAVIRHHDNEESISKLKQIGYPREDGSLSLFIFEGLEKVVNEEFKVAMDIFGKEGGIDCGEIAVLNWYKKRFDVSKIIRWNANSIQNLAFTVEVASKWSDLLPVYESVKAAIARYARVGCHFSHFYRQGASMYFTLYSNIPKDMTADEQFDRIVSESLNACLKHGGTISHHHGVGYAYSKWMPEERKGDFAVLKRIKQSLDPNGIMNIGKLGLKENRYV